MVFFIPNPVEELNHDDLVQLYYILMLISTCIDIKNDEDVCILVSIFFHLFIDSFWIINKIIKGRYDRQYY